VNFDIKTKGDEFIKNVVDILCNSASGGCCGTSQSCGSAKGLIKMLFTNGFKIHLGADEFHTMKRQINLYSGPIFETLKGLVNMAY